MNFYVGTSITIITDHGTQFKEQKWWETLNDAGIKTYKISVYHPTSNPAERVLKEVRQILQTYCHQHHGKWKVYLEPNENFINVVYHEMKETTPYFLMHGTSPLWEITTIVKFPDNNTEEIDIRNYYGWIDDKVKAWMNKYQQVNGKTIKYNIGEKVLLRNRQLPHTVEGIGKKSLLLYTGPYIYIRTWGTDTYYQ